MQLATAQEMLPLLQQAHEIIKEKEGNFIYTYSLSQLVYSALFFVKIL